MIRLVCVHVMALVALAPEYIYEYVCVYVYDMQYRNLESISIWANRHQRHLNTFESVERNHHICITWVYKPMHNLHTHIHCVAHARIYKDDDNLNLKQWCFEKTAGNGRNHLWVYLWRRWIQASATVRTTAAPSGIEYDVRRQSFDRLSGLP